MNRKLLDKYLQIPYKHMGRDKKGVDCWGLILMLYKDVFNVALWDINEDYSEDWHFENKDYFIKNYHKEWIKKETPTMYDIVLFTTKGSANHGGIYLKNNKFLHACTHGVLISRLTDRQNKWENRVEGYYSLRKLKK